MPDMKHSRAARQITLRVVDARIVASTESAAGISPAARRFKTAAAVIALGLLAACGQKGPLFIPDDTGKPAPVTSTVQPGSLNTPTRTTSQSRPTFPTLP